MRDRAFCRIWADQSGATALEYGFLVAFVAAILLGGAMVLAESIGAMFSNVASAVTDKVSKL